MRKLEQAVRRIPSSVGMVGAIVALIPWFPYPGRIVADTKIDLSLDPWGYLARSQSAWDSHAAFGQLQNQAYGYLFPMGPFFGVGRSLDIPEWVVQRAWWSVILLTAFVGMYRLCRRVGIAGRGGSVVAALAFALSPHALTVLGAISIEQWPSAMTPWLILVSLRLLESSGRDRLQATALLAVTCAAVGGVNATATLAAIGVSAIFVLTAGRRGLRVFPLWLVSVVAGTAWWTIPLVVLGVYAFPFLDFIETTTITTAVTSVPNVLRGASHWVPYTGGDWPAGAHLAAAPVAVMATTSVAVCGILGLALRRRWPEDSHARIFAIVSLLTGLTAMGLAYGAQLDLPFTSPFATDARKALDGSLSAFRNVHKFDAMVRLPVSLGLAVTAAAVGRRARDSRSVAVQGVRKYASAAALVGLVLALSVAIAPAVGTSLAPRAPFDAVPQRWYSAADKIDQMAASQGGATLVAPASRFGEYTWGSTRDDPLAALADSPVVERDAIPLGNPGAIRVMDTLDAVLQRGGQQPGLIDVLDRLGIARVVVPHDALQHLSDPETEPGVVGDDSLTESTLMASGLHLVKSWGSGRKRLAIWSTGRSVDAAVAYDARSVVGITGGPEAIISLAAFGEAGEGSPAYVIAPSPRPFEPVLWVQTDSLRRRDLDVAATTSHAYSATLQPGDKLQRRDFPPAGAAAPTTRGFVGLRKVTSSSTSSAKPANDVAAAFDNDYETAWSSALDDERPAISATLARATRVEAVTVQLDSSRQAGSVREVELDVDGTKVRKPVRQQGAELSFPVDRSVHTFRVRLVPAFTEPRNSAGIVNIGLKGVDATSVLDLPDVRTPTQAGSVVVARDEWSTDRPSGRRDDGRVLARRFDVGSALSVANVEVRARTTPAVERLLDGWKVSGPRLDDGPRTRPGAALDGDPATRWTVGYLAGDPTLTVDMQTRQTITGLDGLGKGGRYTRIDSAVIEDLDSGETRRWSSKDPRFEPLNAQRVRVTLDLPRRVSYPFRMPDVTLQGAGAAPASRGSTIVEIPCADGVSVTTGERPATYSARLTRDELLDGSVVSATRCAGSEPTARPGTTVLRATSSELLDAEKVQLGTLPEQASEVVQPLVRTWTDRQRDVELTPSSVDRVVAWHEGFNVGWQATLHGKRLDPVDIDGWRQGFVIPAGVEGLLSATFAPDTTYRAGLAGGGLLVVLMGVLVVALKPRKGRVENRVGGVRMPHWAGRILALAVLSLLGGMGGLVLGVGAVATPSRWRVRLAGAASAALVLGMWRWPIAEKGTLVTVIPQASGLLLVGLLATTLASPVDRREHRTLEKAPRDVGDDERATERETGDDEE